MVFVHLNANITRLIAKVNTIQKGAMDDPQVIALITIDEPEGIYYGGTIAAPVVADIFKNILPYLGINSAEEETTVAFRIYG